jgi:hypothetical protein
MVEVMPGRVSRVFTGMRVMGVGELCVVSGLMMVAGIVVVCRCCMVMGGHAVVMCCLAMFVRCLF